MSNSRERITNIWNQLTPNAKKILFNYEPGYKSNHGKEIIKEGETEQSYPLEPKII